MSLVGCAINLQVKHWGSSPELYPFAVLNGTQLDPRFWPIGDGDGDGPPIPGKSGMRMGTVARMGIGGSVPWCKPERRCPNDSEQPERAGGWLTRGLGYMLANLLVGSFKLGPMVLPVPRNYETEAESPTSTNLAIKPPRHWHLKTRIMF